MRRDSHKDALCVAGAVARSRNINQSTFMVRCAQSLVIGVMLLGTHAALADRTEPASSKAHPGVALARYEKGKSAFEKKLYEDALRFFGESNELQSSPNTRLYMARCHHALGRIGKAFILYRQAALEAQDRMVASGDQRFAATVATARKEAAAIESRVPHVVLVVPADLPEQFVVKLDGAEIPRSTWGTSIEVDPGPHLLLASGPRFAQIERKIVLKEGELQRTELRPQAKPTATLALRFPLRPDGLAATIDGNPLPPNQLELAQDVDVGRHEVVVQAPGYLTYRWRGDLQDGDMDTVTVSLIAQGGTPRVAFIACSVATLAALAVGTGLRVSAERTQSDELAKSQEQRDPILRSNVHTLGTVSTVAFVAAGLSAAATITLGFTTRWRSTTEEKRHRSGHAALLLPWLGSQNVGLSLSGSF